MLFRDLAIPPLPGEGERTANRPVDSGPAAFRSGFSVCPDAGQRNAA